MRDMDRTSSIWPGCTLRPNPRCSVADPSLIVRFGKKTARTSNPIGGATFRDRESGACECPARANSCGFGF